MSRDRGTTKEWAADGMKELGCRGTEEQQEWEATDGTKELGYRGIGEQQEWEATDGMKGLGRRGTGNNKNGRPLMGCVNSE